MLKKISAGALMALVFLIPAAPAVAGAETPVLNEACQTVEPKVFKDLRELISDIDTIDAGQLRLLAYRVLDEATTKEMTVLKERIQEKLGGTEEDLRAFLKTGAVTTWMHELRIAVGRTMTKGGANVKAAAQKVLDAESYDPMLAYLNKGVYEARALDCASQPSPSPSVTPSTTPSATASASASASASPMTPGGEDGEDGEEGGLPVTGANTGTVVGIGGVLLLLGGAGYVIGRRRRSRFVA